ncbi:hypothetical protein LTR53_013826 [Teratosphaeriaceae sp. CCFEE 6253]|nr:hypothetical protein LTR53_013826 [Teratosphaeriaceae sp. CCFEE 6253]
MTATTATVTVTVTSTPIAANSNHNAVVSLAVGMGIAIAAAAALAIAMLLQSVRQRKALAHKPEAHQEDHWEAKTAAVPRCQSNSESVQYRSAAVGSPVWQAPAPEYLPSGPIPNELSADAVRRIRRQGSMRRRASGSTETIRESSKNGVKSRMEDASENPGAELVRSVMGIRALG